MATKSFTIPRGGGSIQINGSGTTLTNPNAFPIRFRNASGGDPVTITAGNSTSLNGASYLTIEYSADATASVNVDYVPSATTSTTPTVTGSSARTGAPVAIPNCDHHDGFTTPGTSGAQSVSYLIALKVMGDYDGLEIDVANWAAVDGGALTYLGLSSLNQYMGEGPSGNAVSYKVGIVHPDYPGQIIWGLAPDMTQSLTLQNLTTGTFRFDGFAGKAGQTGLSVVIVATVTDGATMKIPKQSIKMHANLGLATPQTFAGDAFATTPTWANVVAPAGFTGPVAIRAVSSPSSTKIFAAHTDSNGLAQLDNDYGYVWRAVSALGIPSIVYRKLGETQVGYNPRSNQRRRQLRRGGIHYGALGLNDMNGGRTAAQIAADMVTDWRRAKSDGMTVIQADIPPGYVTLSDGNTANGRYRQAAPQTVIANWSTNATLVNAWLDAGAPLDANDNPVLGGGAFSRLCPWLDKVFSVRRLLEDPANPGKFAPQLVKSYSGTITGLSGGTEKYYGLDSGQAAFPNYDGNYSQIVITSGPNAGQERTTQTWGNAINLRGGSGADLPFNLSVGDTYDVYRPLTYDGIHYLKWVHQDLLGPAFQTFLGSL